MQQKKLLQQIGLNGTYKDYAFFILLDKAINKDNMQALNKLLDYFTLYEDTDTTKENETLTNFLTMLNDTSQKDWE